MPAGAAEITVVREATDDVVQAFARLIAQLAPSSPPLGGERLGELLAAPGTTVWVARAEGAIVGTITLVVFRTPTGLRANIESLVVDEAVRGRGVGEALCRVAMSEAERARADTVDLTSAPTRLAANRLYQRLGFERRVTNVYRWRPRPGP
jgi:ribosomal protein S18 acetylase RimI-like enzyme